MAKAFLEDYPFGKHRSRAMLENAEYTPMLHKKDGKNLTNYYQWKFWFQAIIGYWNPPAVWSRIDSIFLHLFYPSGKHEDSKSRVVKESPMGKNRKTAMKKNLDVICRTLIHCGLAEDMSSFKVA